MPYSIVIPSKNWENLATCLAAICAAESAAKVIVVDDGLTERPQSMEGLDVRVIAGAKPFAFARNCNLGIAAAGTDDVVLLNDDALMLTKNGFSTLAQAVEEHPECGVMSPATNLSGYPWQMRRATGLRTGRGPLAFICVYIPRWVLDTVGLLDERFTAYGWDDNDYCRRVVKAGLVIGVLGDVFVDHHSLPSTFRKPGKPGDIHTGKPVYLQKWDSLAPGDPPW